MRRIKMLYIKEQKFNLGKPQPAQLIEQTFLVDESAKQVDIPCPIGYQIISSTELLPDVELNTMKYEKASN